MAAPKIRAELPLILASLFIASVIWLIAKQSDYEPDQMQAAVKLTNVQDYMSVEASPDKVRVRVQYPKSMINQISDKHFSVPINIETLFDIIPEHWNPPNSTQEKEYKLDTSSIKSDLTQAVQVVGVGQESIRLTAQLRILAADVVVNTVGELPASLMLVGKPQPDPAQLQFIGTREELEKLAAGGKIVKTEPVDLSNLHASGQLSRRVILPPGLKLLGRQMVTINVAVAEKPVRQTLTGVPIALVTFAQNVKASIDPPKADVVMEGPGSVLKSIGPGDIEFSPVRELVERPGKVYDVGLEAHLKSSVPGEVAKQIKIVETKPSRISVEFVPVDNQNK